MPRSPRLFCLIFLIFMVIFEKLKYMVLVHKQGPLWRVYQDGQYRDEFSVHLKNIKFVIIESLQNDSRKTRIKIPHAYAVGELVNSFLVKDITKWEEFNYDVFSNDHFVLHSGEEIIGGKYASFGLSSKVFHPILLKNK